MGGDGDAAELAEAAAFGGELAAEQDGEEELGGGELAAEQDGEASLGGELEDQADGKASPRSSLHAGRCQPDQTNI